MPTIQIPDLGWKVDKVVSEIKPVIEPDAIKPTTVPENKTPQILMLFVENRQTDRPKTPDDKP